MYQVGTLVVYGSSGVCRVAAVEAREGGRCYYTLAPLFGTEIIYVPVDTKVYIRPILSRDEAEGLVRHMPAVAAECMDGQSLQALSRHYQDAISSHDCRDLIRLLKTIHAKDSEAVKRGKKPGKIEERFRKRAEDLLYGELSVALGIDREQVPQYIQHTIQAGS